MANPWQALKLAQKMAKTSNTLPVLSYYHSGRETETNTLRCTNSKCSVNKYLVSTRYQLGNVEY